MAMNVLTDSREIREATLYPDKTSSTAVAERARDASSVSS